MRVPWKARRSNQSTLKEINPEYSLEGLMLKLKLQYSGHLIQTAEKRKVKIKRKRERHNKLDAEFQRRARGDTKGFLKQQCKERNNRMEKN